MPIDPARLARSLGALDTLDVERGFTGTLQQVLHSARTLLDVDMAWLMLVDHAGALRWASASDPMVESHVGELEQLAHGPCRAAFAQRAPAAVPDRSAEPRWSELAQAGIDAGIHAGLSVPVQLGGGRLRRTAGTRSCMRMRPDGMSGEARLAGRRPSACRQPLRAAGSSTPNGVAPTNDRRRFASAARSTTGWIQPVAAETG
jgi:GAF domain